MTAAGRFGAVREVVGVAGRRSHPAVSHQGPGSRGGASGDSGGGVLRVLGRPGMARDLVGWALGSGSRPAAPVTVLVDPDDTHWSQVDGSAVVVVTSDPVGPGRAAELVLRGADAVVTVDAGVEAVRAAVRGVGAGGTLLDPVVARLVVDAARSACAATLGTAPNLSPREAEILGCIARGMSVKQTARTLGVAHKTVENLQGRLFRKLGARNRAQAVARAADLGLLDALAG